MTAVVISLAVLRVAVETSPATVPSSFPRLSAVIFRMEGVVKPYAWGSTTFIPELRW